MMFIMSKILFRNSKKNGSASLSKYIGIILKRKKQLHSNNELEIQKVGSSVIFELSTFLILNANQKSASKILDVQ